MTKEGSIKLVNFMNPGSGVLMLRHCHISHIMTMHYFFLKTSSLLLIIDLTTWIYSNDNHTTKIVNFMTLKAGVNLLQREQISHIVKMHYFFWKSSSLLLSIDQTNWIYSNDDQERVYQNCKFHDPQGKGCFATSWTYKSYIENAFFLWKSDKLKICNVVIMTKEWSTTIVNFLTSGAGVFVLGLAI